MNETRLCTACEGTFSINKEDKKQKRCPSCVFLGIQKGRASSLNKLSENMEKVEHSSDEFNYLLNEHITDADILDIMLDEELKLEIFSYINNDGLTDNERLILPHQIGYDCFSNVQLNISKNERMKK
jgi:hypothetical protein